MSLSELQKWLDTENGIKPQLDKLRIWSASLSFGYDVIEINEAEVSHDWQKLLFAASIFAESQERQYQEYALMVAQSAVCFSENPLIQDAGSLVLSRLSNHRTIDLAQSKQLIEPAIGQRVGMSEQLLWVRRRLNSEIILNAKHSISGNHFQTNFWSKLSNSDWLSATAPTSAGKTFIVLN